MRGAMPNTVARRRLTAFGWRSSAFSTSTFSIAYCEIGRSGDSSVQKLFLSPLP